MYKVSATMDGQPVTLVDVQQNGQDVYIAYITSGGDFKVTKKIRNYTTSAGTIIATGAVAP